MTKHADPKIVRNNLWDWQELQPGAGPGQAFYRFCDALEVKDGVSAPAEGWGLEHALDAWGFYWRTRYYSQRKSFRFNLGIHAPDLL